MAIYDAPGRLIRVQNGNTVTINSGNNTGSFSGINIPSDVARDYKVKLFLWTSAGEMVPLSLPTSFGL